MRLSDLRPNESRTKNRKRVGRGHAAGQGKTCGKGQKGQASRGPMKFGFEGGQTPMYRRLPSLRGQSNRAHNIGLFRKEYSVVKVGDLDRFEAGQEIGPAELKAVRLVRQMRDGVKILAGGELSRPLKVQAHAFSESARATIEQAGGTAEVIGS